MIRAPLSWLPLAAALALYAGLFSGEAIGAPASVTEQEMSNKAKAMPDYLTALESAYGASSEAGFGSAVFFETLGSTDDLTQAALAKYRTFVGELWERYGEAAWMAPWQEVYARKAGVKPDIAAELRGIADREAQLSVPMILDNIEGADAARAALSGAFDDPAVTELRAFNLGDGEAMSGLLVAGRRGSGGDTTFLVFLMD